MTNKEKQLNDMRLIDANELIKHAVTVYQGNGVELEPIQVVPVAAIDNAETYNQVGHKMATAEGFITNPEWHSDFKAGYKQAILDGQTNFKRPQGEWIFNKEMSVTCSLWNCSVCNRLNGNDSFNYCPNCGADMRGKEE